ncbi:hypothetical protein ABH922_000701 [Rhodococcus sp. 27YEA15]|uniref:hypothetical protein n=1 Tax=Rhodococcus sp. 27YEA15 TaxID=3156259 RepID=UPI003C7CAAB1
MRVTTLVVLAVLVLVGCSAGAQTTRPASPARPVAASHPDVADFARGTPVPDEVDDSRIGTEFVDRPDIVSPIVTMVESWSEVDATTLAVHFVTGTPQCYGAYVTVEETDATVIVSLRTGSLPEAADKMCVTVAVLGSLDVPLSRPLGERHVVNG